MQLIDQAIYLLPDGTRVVAAASWPALVTWWLRAAATTAPPGCARALLQWNAPFPLFSTAPCQQDVVIESNLYLLRVFV